jgi:hypothetical protein
MDQYTNFFMPLLEAPGATDIIDLWEQGLLTYQESIDLLMENYNDSLKTWYVICRENRRGAKWIIYGQPEKDKKVAKAKADSLKGKYFSVNGKEILFDIRGIYN